MITLFSLPKPFVGEMADIQNKAIRSWKKAGCKVILFKEEELKKNKYGTPLVSDMIMKAQERATTPLVSYISCDIIINRSFMEWIRMIDFENFLAIGQRHDILKDGSIKAHGLSAFDYWLFPKGMISCIPDLAIGRAGNDNWLLWKCKQMNIPTIDTSPVIKVFHQYHDYSHRKIPKKIEEWEHIQMAGGFKNFCTLRDTDYILTKNGLIKRPWSIYNIIKPLLPLWRKIKWQLK
jgi:hypothetical protein